MAAVHRVDWRALGLDFVDDPARGAAGLEQQLQYYEEALAWAEAAEDGRPHPGARAALAWLDRDTSPTRPRGGDDRVGRRAARQPDVRRRRDRRRPRLGDGGVGRPADRPRLVDLLRRRRSPPGRAARASPGSRARRRRWRAGRTLTGRAAGDLHWFLVFAGAAVHRGDVAPEHVVARDGLLARAVRLRQPDQQRPRPAARRRREVRYGVIADPLHRLGRRLPLVQRALERVQQHVADLARVDELVEAEALRRAVRRLELHLREQLGLVDVGARATGSSPPRPSRPSSRRATRTRPTGCRSRSCPSPSSRSRRPCAASPRTSVPSRSSAPRTCARRLRRMPRRSDAVPGSTPGLSARKTSGRWNESATVMKCDALSAPSTSIEPANTWGWLATTATGWPPRCASAHTTDLPEVGLHLEPRRLVDDDVDDVAHVVDPPAVAGHDVEDLRDEARRGVVVHVVGRVRPRRRREVAQVETHELERGFVVGRDVVDQSARHRDRRPAELLLGDRLPQRLEHHRRPGGEDGARARSSPRSRTSAPPVRRDRPTSRAPR